MARLKPSEETKLRELAERDPRIASELKKHDQLTAILTDILTQQKTQNRKNRTRELLLIGTAMTSEFEKNPQFKEGIKKVLDRHLTRNSDKKFMAGRGWEIAYEAEISTNNDSISTI